MTASDGLNAGDEVHLRAAFRAAGALARAGQLPFAARLAGPEGDVLLTAENEVQRSGDPTAHAEVVLLRRASERFGREALARMTVYTAAEPCGMCAAALVLGGVGRIVYGMSAERLGPQLALPVGVVVPGVGGRAMLDATPGGPRVIGPALEDEAQAALFGDKDDEA
ncbi:MAG TPA: nucleoside deaminase [Longimicrobium sp.]|nr:nucleoside deaminase [Longimicrobium sp.]